MKTFSQFIAETHDHWADHSDKYQLKKGVAKPTEVHSGQPDRWTGKAQAPKHIMHVIHKESGAEIGTIKPYSASQDKKKPGARIVTSRKSVTRHSFSFHKGHGPESHEMGTYVTMKHTSPKEALRTMAREHQAHLQKTKTESAEESTIQLVAEVTTFAPGTKVTYQRTKTARGNAVVSRKSDAKKKPHYYITTDTEGTILVPADELDLQEAYEDWKDYSDHYTLKKASVEPSTKKHVYHVHDKETGEKVGEMHPSTSTSYTHSGRGNIASGARNVTSYDVRIPGVQAFSRGVDRSTPKKALKHFASTHQLHLATKK